MLPLPATRLTPVLALTAGFLPAAAAQDPTVPQRPPDGVVTWPAQPWTEAGQDPSRRQPSSTGYPGLDTIVPQFRGFPVFAPDADGRPPTGFPGFQQDLFRALGEDLAGRVPAPAMSRPEGLWPSWLLSAADEQSRPSQVIVARTADRVWVRAAGEDAYVPLSHWDKLRRLESGSGVQVRGGPGEATFYFHDGATLRSVGPFDTELLLLNATVGELELRRFRQVWLRAGSRQVRLRLADTSVLEVERSYVYLRREGDRGWLRNYGPGTVTLRSPLGVVQLERNREIAVLLEPIPRARPAITLTVDGTAQARIDGRRAELAGGTEGGAVAWMGVRVKLRAGQTARIDALVGEVFPEYRAAVGSNGAKPR